jgi:hypothetical protein
MASLCVSPAENAPPPWILGSRSVREARTSQRRCGRLLTVYVGVKHPIVSASPSASPRWAPSEAGAVPFGWPSRGITGHAEAVKAAVSIPDDLFREIDARARALNLSQSAFLARAGPRVPLGPPSQGGRDERVERGDRARGSARRRAGTDGRTTAHQDRAARQGAAAMIRRGQRLPDRDAEQGRSRDTGGHRAEGPHREGGCRDPLVSPPRWLIARRRQRSTAPQWDSRTVGHPDPPCTLPRARDIIA